MRVLLVEHDDALGATMKLALERAGHTLDWTPDGRGAAAAARAQSYAAILLDLSLRGTFGGADLVRALRDARDRTPVIVVTARDARDERLRLLDVGAATLDLVARAATFDGAAVPLTAKEFRTLAELMRRPGRFVTKSELEAAVYDDGTEVESNTIEVAIYSLRRKFDAKFVVTARGLGYMVPR